MKKYLDLWGFLVLLLVGIILAGLPFTPLLTVDEDNLFSGLLMIYGGIFISLSSIGCLILTGLRLITKTHPTLFWGVTTGIYLIILLLVGLLTWGGIQDGEKLGMYPLIILIGLSLFGLLLSFFIPAPTRRKTTSKTTVEASTAGAKNKSSLP